MGGEALLSFPGAGRGLEGDLRVGPVFRRGGGGGALSPRAALRGEGRGGDAVPDPGAFRREDPRGGLPAGGRRDPGQGPVPLSGGAIPGPRLLLAGDRGGGSLGPGEVRPGLLRRPPVSRGRVRGGDGRGRGGARVDPGGDGPGEKRGLRRGGRTAPRDRDRGRPGGGFAGDRALPGSGEGAGGRARGGGGGRRTLPSWEGRTLHLRRGWFEIGSPPLGLPLRRAGGAFPALRSAPSAMVLQAIPW